MRYHIVSADEREFGVEAFGFMLADHGDVIFVMEDGTQVAYFSFPKSVVPVEVQQMSMN